MANECFFSLLFCLFVIYHLNYAYFFRCFQYAFIISCHWLCKICWLKLTNNNQKYWKIITEMLVEMSGRLWTTRIQLNKPLIKQLHWHWMAVPCPVCVFFVSLHLLSKCYKIKSIQLSLVGSDQTMANNDYCLPFFHCANSLIITEK